MNWGVDSARTANSNALDGTVCFDSVTQRAGAAPAFWGRYIGGNYALTSGEAAFLLGCGCKIALIYNGASNSVASVGGGFIEGQADATRATQAAQAVGAPAGTSIFVDIEGSWFPTSDWLRGWATQVVANGYTQGFYCDATIGSGFEQAYCTAQGLEPAVAAALLWSMEPEPGPQCQPAGQAPAFNPAQPSCGGNVMLWQYTEDCWEDTLGHNAGIDMNLATDTALASMW